MSETNNNINDAIAALQAAFSEGATLEEMKKGETVLGAMLAALRGAMSAKSESQEDAPSSAKPAEPTVRESQAPPKKAAAKPDMLDFVVGFLKSKLDDDDLAKVESQSPPFSVPFINM